VETKCINTILELFEKYKHNEYMFQRLQNHILTYLPNTLDNECKNYEKRVIRNNYLTSEQNVFIQVFLSKNKYFYLPNNNFFYEYDGEKYLIVKEDDIIHKLLSTISKDRVLLQWKYKTKIHIVKQIKERSLFSSVPETDTIQNVLNVLYPTIFSSKNTAKYFLTIIGDNIFKKNPQVIILVSQKFKQILNELDNVAITSIGNSNTTHNFMTKYHENHSYDNCRIIKMSENFSNDIWRTMLKKIGLDLLCVAAHYSKRYENSDKFIENKSDDELRKYTYYLKNTTQNLMVKDFCNKYIIECSQEYNLEWKNLHFIWKQSLFNNNLPNVIYTNTLKHILKENYIYNETTDSFSGITSKYLPLHIDFIQFWENTVIIKNNTTTVNDNDIINDMYSDIVNNNTKNNYVFDNELELDELYSLFKYWCKKNPDKIISTGNITEDNILKILKHFFPEVEIIEEKFILNVTCSIWNKISDMDNSFEYIREEVKNTHTLPLISFDDAYNYYYKFCNSKNGNNLIENKDFKFIVSKRFFEKYLYYKLSDHIVYDKFIETTWL
jgi:hypothetical protein